MYRSHTHLTIPGCGGVFYHRRWAPSRKCELIDSRVDTTNALLRGIAEWKTKPHTLLVASGIGFYGNPESKPVDEDSPQGEGFLAELCQAWEQSAQQGENLGLRVVTVRFGMVLGLDGGALPKMSLPFQWYLGGPISPGTQYVSWIHQEDLANLLHWLLTDKGIEGPVNGVTAQPVTMKEFCSHLGTAMNRPSWFPVPEFLLKILLGELATMLTTGQRVIPGKAIESARLESSIGSCSSSCLGCVPDCAAIVSIR